MRAYYFAALVTLTGCREIVRELLKEDDGSRSTSTSTSTADPAAAPPPAATPTDEPTPKATATAQKTATAAKAVAPTCANVCEKLLKCMNAFTAADQSACVKNCGTADPAKAAQLLQMDCQTLIATVNKGGGGGGGAAPNKQTSPCNDCSTCVWDGTSCYSRVPPYLACNACCCAKGGPAPRWD